MEKATAWRIVMGLVTPDAIVKPNNTCDKNQFSFTTDPTPPPPRNPHFFFSTNSDKL